MSFYVRYSLIYFILVNNYTQGQFLGAYQGRKPLQPLLNNVLTNNIYRLNRNMDPINSNNNNNVNRANIINNLNRNINLLNHLSTQYNLNNRLNMNNMNLNNNNVNPNNFIDERNKIYENANNNNQNAPNDYSEASAGIGANLYNNSYDAYQPLQQNYNLNSHNNNIPKNDTQSNVGDNKELAKIVAQKVMDYLTSDESGTEDKKTTDLNNNPVETNANDARPNDLDNSSITSRSFDNTINNTLRKEKEKHEEKHEHEASHKHKHILKSLKVSKFLFQVKPVVPETSRKSDKETIYYIE